ncbi:hypothetical protein HanIR_Chr14g0724311 [Helianthus annuus]|nr:hypothetical protein HanIR_Chr14g0724311 [Helianthus annuus]
MYLIWSLFSNRRLDFDSDSDEGEFEDVEDEVSPRMTDCYIAVPKVTKEVHPFADEVDAMIQMKVLLSVVCELHLQEKMCLKCLQSERKRGFVFFSSKTTSTTQHTQALSLSTNSPLSLYNHHHHHHHHRTTSATTIAPPPPSHHRLSLSLYGLSLSQNTLSLYNHHHHRTTSATTTAPPPPSHRSLSLSLTCLALSLTDLSLSQVSFSLRSLSLTDGFGGGGF